jgi:hypothetical protein
VPSCRTNWTVRDAAALGQYELDGVRLTRIRDEQVLPAWLAGPGLLLGIKRPVRELVEKDARLDVAFHLLREDVEHDRPIALVRVRDRLDHHEHRRRRGDARQEHHRTQQSIGADAARQQRDRLAIRRHPSEADEQPYEERHGNRQSQRLRAQQDDDVAGCLPRDAFRDQPFELVHYRR